MMRGHVHPGKSDEERNREEAKTDPPAGESKRREEGSRGRGVARWKCIVTGAEPRAVPAGFGLNIWPGTPWRGLSPRLSFTRTYLSISALPPASRNSIVILLGALLLHAAGTWIIPLVDRDEPRFSEASRETRERGDYVIPWFNDKYRFDK